MYGRSPIIVTQTGDVTIDNYSNQQLNLVNVMVGMFINWILENLIIRFIVLKSLQTNIQHLFRKRTFNFALF